MKKKKRLTKKKKTSVKKPKKIIKRTVRKRLHPSIEKVNLSKMLIENFVSLQKVMTNVSVKYDNLANQISKLLRLFELSAKTLAEKDFNPKEKQKDNKEIMEKIETLLEQNKIIARGLTLMHERIPEQEEFIPIRQPPLPTKRTNQQDNSNIKKDSTNIGEYQKSISVNSQNKKEAI